jgi:hypothetical protein
MNCLSDSGEHRFYIDGMDDENNYYKCRHCEIQFRIMRFFIDERYRHGRKAKTI